jgi:hypothetical protein
MFKLSEEMINEIEEKVNTMLKDVRGGMKERLVKAGCYNEFASVTVCEISIEIETEKVIVHDPIQYSEDNEEEGDYF